MEHSLIGRTESSRALPGRQELPAAERLPRPEHMSSDDDTRDTLSSLDGVSSFAHRSGIEMLQKKAKEVAAMKSLVLKWEQVSMPFGDLKMTPLMKACAKGNLHAVEEELKALSSNAEQLAKELASGDDWAGSTPLHWAAYSGVASCVQRVLQQGGDARARNARDKSMPIHLAARYGRPDVLSALADWAPDTLAATNERGYTPLHESAIENKLAGVQFFLERSVQLQLTSPELGISLQSLLSTATPATKGGQTPLLVAVEYGQLGVVQMLIKARADLSTAPLNSDNVLYLEEQTSKGSEPVTQLRSWKSAHGLLDVKTDMLEFKKRVSQKSLLGKTGRPTKWHSELASSTSFKVHRHTAGEPQSARPSFAQPPAYPYTCDFTRQLLCDAMAAIGSSAFWTIPGHGAVSLALSAGHLDVLIALLEASALPPIFSEDQLLNVVLGLWAKKRTNGTEEDQTADGIKRNARLFTALVLCARKRRVVQANDDEGAGASSSSISLPYKPQNPCLVALQLASKCREATRLVSRDRLRVNRLIEAEMLLQFVASGLVYCADQDAQAAAVTKGFNMWRMGKQHIQPIVARDVYVNDSIEHAAEHDCKIFISQPLVYEHFHGVFWPHLVVPEHDSALWYYTSLIALNVMMLPLLPFVPSAIEAKLEQLLCDDHTAGRPSRLLWTLPSGRFALWFAAMLLLAQLATIVSPRPDHLGAWDFGMLAYLIGIIKAEYGEASTDFATYGQIRRYLFDPFNVLDMLLVVLLLLLLLSRHAHTLEPPGTLDDWELPAQTLLSLVAWLRLVQILFIFSKSGPLLLMTIRMLEDLWQFLMLSSIIVIAFACSFYVLLAHEHALLGEREYSMGEEDEGSIWPVNQPARKFCLVVGTSSADKSEHAFCACPCTHAQVLSMLITATMKGEPDHILIESNASSNFARGIMFLFGVVVVLLLLNLLIARFSKTFDMVYENVDANFKVAFARIVVEGRKKELMPPPLNLIRQLVDACFGVLRGAAGLAPYGLIRSAQLKLMAATDGMFEGLRGAHRDTWSSQCVRCIWTDERAWPYRRFVELADDQAAASTDAKQLNDSSNVADGEEWIAERVAEYIRKALEHAQGEKGTLIDQVVHFVTTRWYDIGREEQWRTDMTRQLGHVEMLLNNVQMRMSHFEGLIRESDRSEAIAQRVEQRVASLLKTHTWI